jgi:Amt family ammonium transporter
MLFSLKNKIFILTIQVKEFLMNKKATIAFLILSFNALPLFAGTGTTNSDTINTGDTAWLLISTALVFLMVPSLAFFYGGLVRRKNILSVLMQCFAIMCVVSLVWMIIGYSIAFGPDWRGIAGKLTWAFLNGVTTEPFLGYAANVPHYGFMIFQNMFAIITPALIIGAFAERMRFMPFMFFTILWSIFIYSPTAHWVWGIGGWLRNYGALDFAGGTVVHVNAGAAALASAIVLGKRTGYPCKISPPHNLPFAVLGAGLLWFGWFGFNAGSALAANGLATNAFVVTQIAAAAAGTSWMIVDFFVNNKATVLGIITGAVAGLVAITPAAGFVNPASALVIGFGAGVICYFFVSYVKVKVGYDDALDAFGVHGIGGLWGSFATGLFATKAINPAGTDGLFYGNPSLLLTQMGTSLIVGVYSFLASLFFLKAIDFLIGLRITERNEHIGLDLVEHSETGYTIID